MFRRRIVLGFDSSCSHCSHVAAAIQEAAGGRIEVMGLDETPMREWRISSARPQPTLVVVTSRGQRVCTKIHNGWSLPLVLAAKLGPIPATRVLTALGASQENRHRAGDGSAPQSKGALSRRTVLGGLTAAVGLVVGAATVGRYMAAHAPIDVRPLESGSLELSRLKTSPAVKVAADRFGTADWYRVVAARDSADGSLHYFVPYASDRNGTAQLLTTASGRDSALVLRQVSHGNGSGQVDIYEVRGAPIGSLPLGRPSVSSPAVPLLPPDIYRGSVGSIRLTSSVVPSQLDRAFFRCFGNCLQANGAQDAIEPCLSCVTGNYLYCFECTIRAGFQAKKCYGECGGPMLAGALPF